MDDVRNTETRHLRRRVVYTSAIMVWAIYIQNWWLVASFGLVLSAVTLPESSRGLRGWLLLVCAVLLAGGLLCLVPALRDFEKTTR